MKKTFKKISIRLRHNLLYSKFLELTGNNLKDRKWIFILGCYNSGTTLLDQILSDHPQISGLSDEGVILTNKLPRPEDFNWRRMWSKCEKEMNAHLKDEYKTAETIKKHWSHFFGNEEYLVEKSISNVCRIPFFQKKFGEVYFIHIVRNGYAVAEGIRRKAEIMPENTLFEKEKKYPIDFTIKQWTTTLDKIEESKDLMSNFLEVSYENLTENPDKVMLSISHFLNIKTFSDGYFDKTFSVHEKNSEIKNMNNKSFKNLSIDEINVINNLASDYLTRYSYPIL